MVKGQKEKRDQFPTIITCPNEVRRRLHDLRIYVLPLLLGYPRKVAMNE